MNPYRFSSEEHARHGAKARMPSVAKRWHITNNARHRLAKWAIYAFFER
jgi:hypothetical protein